MSESSDYTPGPWAGHDFGNARQHYDRHAGRSYSASVSAGVAASSLVPNEITTESANPLLIMCDVSGSMSGWPNTIFAKLPYLDHEVKTEYLGADAEVSFAAISDTGDQYPFQIKDFAKGLGLKDSLEKLIITNGGAGSGQYCEAYLVAALYAINNVKMPNALVKPTLIMIGDEMPNDTINKQEAIQHAKVNIEEGRLAQKEIMDKLMAIYSVYFILKPYGSSKFGNDTMAMDGTTKLVYTAWERLIGADRIAFLGDADRVVDVIFGILAKESGKVQYFKKEIEGRQRKDQVDTVYRALNTVHRLEGKEVKQLPKGGGKSTLHRPGGGKKSSSLI